MTTEQRLIALAQAIGTDVKGLLSTRGNLTNLNTQAKNSLVSALNELWGLLADAQEINDASAPTSVNSTYSANKINTLIAAAKNEILGGAGSAYDTLMELQQELLQNDSAIGGLLTATGNKVDYSTAQSLSVAQQAQACANIGIGNPDANLVTSYTTARDAV